MEQQSKEWQLMEKAILASVEEQKRARRWRLFFIALFFVYLFVMLGVAASGGDKFSQAANKEHTALVKIHGPIMEEERASANMIVGGMRAAFKNKNSKAVLLAINSPGGSPVHAGYVYDEINRLREKYPEKKVYAVISDLGASAAYYIAAAADEIYADKASLVGSIGVISASFGFTGAMEKVGVERRVIASGSNKAFLDPFQPLKEDEKVFWQDSLDVIHQQFIKQVRKGRGDRLVEDDKIFSGLIWSGEQALDKGLIDGLASAGRVARDVVGAEDIVDYTVKPNPFDELVQQFGLSASASLLKQLRLENHYPQFQ